MALTVDENGYLFSGITSLGVKVLRGTEFIRNFKDYSEAVPGKDGEILFGVDMEAGLISLPCFVETTPDTWDAKEAEIMGYLNPKLGVQTLTFANRPGKVYNVLYIGQLKFAEEGPGYRMFTIPFKMHDPLIKASTQSTLTGSGTAVNGGNDETPCIVEIVGLVTNPSVTIGGKTMTYTGTVTASDMLIIDTEKLTCTFNGANALGNLTGLTPSIKLAVGNNVVTVTGGTVTLKWNNKFI
jgi:phage-related protein